MSTILEIQEAIVVLPEEERVALKDWLNAFEEDEWDRQITADAASGRLSYMTQEMERAKRERTLLPLPGEI